MYLTAAQLTQELGGRWHGHYGLAFCPAHENHRTPALSIAVSANGSLLLHCFAGCTYREVAKSLDTLGHEVKRQSDDLQVKAVKAAETSQSKRRADQARRIWKESIAIPTTLAEQYLRERGIRKKLPASLRYHPSCWHGPSAQRLPAMIAIIDEAEGFAIHRTFLASDGLGKAKVAPNKMMLGASAGGAVRLGQSEFGGPLVVSEGIETGLSLHEGLVQTCGPVWAALSTSGMANLKLPEKSGPLVIATDGDEAGRAAGRKLASRAHSLGWQVSLLDAPDKRDWNDILMAGEFCI